MLLILGTVLATATIAADDWDEAASEENTWTAVGEYLAEMFAQAFVDGIYFFVTLEERPEGEWGEIWERWSPERRAEVVGTIDRARAEGRSYVELCSILFPKESP